jgi:hypothetical protein
LIDAGITPEDISAFIAQANSADTWRTTSLALSQVAARIAGWKASRPAQASQPQPVQAATNEPSPRSALSEVVAYEPLDVDYDGDF